MENKPFHSNKSFKTHQGMLRRIVKDDRMQPSRRLLAEMLLMYLEGYIEKDLLYLAFGGQQKVQWNKGINGEKADPQAATSLDLKTSEEVKKAYQDLADLISGGDNGNTTNTAAGTDSGSDGA